MSGPSAHERVKKLEARGVIRGYAAIVDPAARRATGSWPSRWITQAPGTVGDRPDRDVRGDPRDRGVPPHHGRGRLPDQGPGPRHPRPRADPAPGPGDAERLPDRDRRRLLERLRAPAAPRRRPKPTRPAERNDGRGPSRPERRAALVREVAAGSQDALAALYDRHVDAVYAAASRLTSDRQIAEEVVQETFLALWNRAELFNPRPGRWPRGCTRSPGTGPSTGCGRPAGGRISSRSRRQRVGRAGHGGPRPARRGGDGPRRGGPRAGAGGRAGGDGAARRDPDALASCRSTSGPPSCSPTARS